MSSLPPGSNDKGEVLSGEDRPKGRMIFFVIVIIFVATILLTGLYLALPSLAHALSSRSQCPEGKVCISSWSVDSIATYVEVMGSDTVTKTQVTTSNSNHNYPQAYVVSVGSSFPFSASFQTPTFASCVNTSTTFNSVVSEDGFSISSVNPALPFVVPRTSVVNMVMVVIAPSFDYQGSFRVLMNVTVTCSL